MDIYFLLVKKKSGDIVSPRVLFGFCDPVGPCVVLLNYLYGVVLGDCSVD